MSAMPGTRASAPIIPATASIAFPMTQPMTIATSAVGERERRDEHGAGDDDEERDAEVPPEEARSRGR